MVRSATLSRTAGRQFVVPVFAVRQRGGVAVLVGLSIALMIGFAGLALDLGRLFVNKTELQSAADACALAAARQLMCDVSHAGAGGCPAQFLVNAEVAGIFTAGRNYKDLQGSAVVVAPGDVKFSTALAPNSGYLGRTAGASVNSKFVMCTARSTGLVPWFMGVMGLAAPNSVGASAVASVAPSQDFCQGPPIGVCRKSGGVAPAFGYVQGEWIESQFTSAANRDALEGNFRWIDFSPTAGGNSEIREALCGQGGRCDLQVGSDVVQQGQQQGAKSAYNTRFGIYGHSASAESPEDAPPDYSGYAYPNKAPASPVIDIGTSAYADYLARTATGDPFNPAEYGVTGPGSNIAGEPVSASVHLKGGNRRLVNVPVVDCEGGNNVKILGMVCVLMLNPMSSGASGSLYLEYRSPSNVPGSPCPAIGSPGGVNGTGPMVPTLVQ